MGPPKTSSKPTKRWRPTPEQVMILKGLFRGGLTTPTSLQIQKITSQLIEYGKVESKNIFYWFQNHKAREKQKLITRKLHHHNNNNPFYFFYIPTQYPATFSPISPAHHQTMRDLTRFNITKQEDAKKDCDYEDKVNVTWLATDSDSSSTNHHRKSRHESRLKTLELFPTTSASR